MQAYNTQVAVEPVLQLIVGQAVTPAGNDKQHLVPMIDRIEERSGQKPQEVLADSGYCSAENLRYLGKRKITGWVATEKWKHGEPRQPCPRGPLPSEAGEVERMRRKLQARVGGGV